jgi:hypothetical protein
VRGCQLPAPAALTWRWWRQTLAINAVIAVAVLALIQLVPVPRQNPPVLSEPAWDSSELRDLARAACFDCHSHQTEWPWYGRIAPVSWVMWYDVTEGREDLDFSDWDRLLADEIAAAADPLAGKTLAERIADEIRGGTMPPATYRLLHPEARLTDAEREFLIEGLTRLLPALE